jgi:hypothetical protein
LNNGFCSDIFFFSYFFLVNISDDPFVRGAEFWQVHDLMMKMILTGMLIYVPPTSRAGIATLVCVVAVANLNYFKPQKVSVII